jgi:diadenosine tetraphosphate (Ap4A) HIT family hydrolase
MLKLVEEGKSLLDRVYAPAGYNIGVNVGEAAGQTINHVHMHVIPRYRGDTPNPRGGVRGVIPDNQSY